MMQDHGEHARAWAIETILACRIDDRANLLKAVFDLCRNAKLGDDQILYPLLDHPDADIVASTLHGLFEVFQHKAQLKSAICALANGDPRDSWEMPIQTMAVNCLGKLAVSDPESFRYLLQIAENRDFAEVPHKRAWQCLAELANAEWRSTDSEDMIMDPDSEASESIRCRIRAAIAERRSRQD